MIESKEDAEKYLKEVINRLDGLVKLSEEAGLYSHAAIFCTLAAAFSHSIEEIETIRKMMSMYLEASAERYIDFGI